MANNNNPKKQQTKKKANPALRYTGMATQMAASILLGVWLGGKLDTYYQTPKPYFVLTLSILFLGIIMYYIVRDVSKNG